MRTLSTPTGDRVDLEATQPGYLVLIEFSTPQRFSTRGDVTWNSLVYTSADLSVRGLVWDGKAEQNGTLNFTSLDNALITLILSEGVAGRRVAIWKFYEGAVAVGDPLMLFDGHGDSLSINPETSDVTITLKGAGSTTQFTPRRFISKPVFNFLPAPGTVFQMGNQTITLERG